MNKFFSIILFSLVAVTVQAQARKFNLVNFNPVNVKQFRSISDTLIPKSFIDSASGGLGCALTSYSLDITNPVDSGYVSGTNIYGDLEKGQRYFLSDFGYDTVTVHKLIVHFSVIHPNGSLGLAVGKVYTLNSLGFPDSLIATSVPISIASISVIINGIAEFDFLSDVKIANGFLATIDFSNCLADTVALVQTEMNCFDHTNGAWEKWSDSTWHSFNNSWQFESDLSVFPLLSDGVTLSSDYILNKNQIDIYPNPANDFINIYSFGEFKNISIYNSIGNKVYFNSGLNSVTLKIDLSSFPNGVYYLTGDEKKYFSPKKFIVLH